MFGFDGVLASTRYYLPFWYLNFRHAKVFAIEEASILTIANIDNIDFDCSCC